MIKLIALDLDDTLLNSKKEISPKNMEALKACMDLGIKIVIATGRPFEGVQKVIDDLGIRGMDTYSINFNGAMIYSLKDNTPIRTVTMLGSDIKKIYESSLIKNNNFHAFQINQTLITPKMNEMTDYEAYINHIKPTLRDMNTVSFDEPFLKCMIVDPEPLLTPNLKYYEDLYNKDYSVFRSAPFFLEFLNPLATKGEGLKFLAEYLGYDISETMAFGDSENDLSMIIAAGIGVAMNGAYDHIKEKADFVTLDCKDDGVAYAINKFVLNKACD